MNNRIKGVTLESQKVIITVAVSHNYVCFTNIFKVKSKQMFSGESFLILKCSYIESKFMNFEIFHPFVCAQCECTHVLYEHITHVGRSLSKMKIYLTICRNVR